MNNAKLIQISEKDAIQISKSENITVEQAKQFFMKSDGKFYVMKAGLLYKLAQKSPKFSISVCIPEDDELSKMKKMLNIKDGEKMAIMKATVTTKDGVFSDYGSAGTSNCRNQSYLIEMSSTRAVNRAIRLATSMGYCSVEEIEQEPVSELPNIDVKNLKVVDDSKKLTEKEYWKRITDTIIHYNLDKNKIKDYSLKVWNKDLSKLNLSELNYLNETLDNKDSHEKFKVNKPVENNSESIIDKIFEAGKAAGFSRDKILNSIKSKYNKSLEEISDKQKEEILNKLEQLATKQVKKAA